MDLDSVTVFKGMMRNFEVWNSNFRNERSKTDCIDEIKYQMDERDKIAVIASKNVEIFMKKTVEKHLLQMIEGLQLMKPTKF